VRGGETSASRLHRLFSAFRESCVARLARRPTTGLTRTETTRTLTRLPPARSRCVPASALSGGGRRAIASGRAATRRAKRAGARDVRGSTDAVSGWGSGAPLSGKHRPLPTRRPARRSVWRDHAFGAGAVREAGLVEIKLTSRRQVRQGAATPYHDSSGPPRMTTCPHARTARVRFGGGTPDAGCE
jgi:hypothetical protein